ncbi:hypothetical protein GCM10010207_79530 [Streptomyces atratus]|nr:hypothetical protein GCM10010207_79530 [Streptomyces atratus]
MEGAGDGPSYKGFRFPAEVISHAVWLYHRFPLSFREVEELLLARGITVSHEAIRRWCDRFGLRYAAALRRRRPQAGDKWHLDKLITALRREGADPVRKGRPWSLPLEDRVLLVAASPDRRPTTRTTKPNTPESHAHQ